MKRELLGLALTGTLVLGASACSNESAQTKHEKAVASANTHADGRVAEAQSVYQLQYLAYLAKLGLKCVNALNDASLQDDADFDAGKNTFTKETAAVLIADYCPTGLSSNDRANLYKSYHASVGDPLRDLIKEGALADGTLSAGEVSTYRSDLVSAYLQGTVSNVDSGEYIIGNWPGNVQARYAEPTIIAINFKNSLMLACQLISGYDWSTEERR